jgi:hypothetical protein
MIGSSAVAFGLLSGFWFSGTQNTRIKEAVVLFAQFSLRFPRCNSLIILQSDRIRFACRKNLHKLRSIKELGFHNISKNGRPAD